MYRSRVTSALQQSRGITDGVIQRGDGLDLGDSGFASGCVADGAGDGALDVGRRDTVGQQHGDLCVEPVEDPGQGSAEGGVHREDKQPLRKEQEERAHGVRASGVGPSR